MTDDEKAAVDELLDRVWKAMRAADRAGAKVHGETLARLYTTICREVGYI